MFGKKADDKIAKKQAEQEAKDKAANNSLMVFPLDFPENATVKTNSAVTREPRNAPTDTP